jgi:hypothetical protein
MFERRPVRSPLVPGVTKNFCVNETFCGCFAVPEPLGLKLTVAL